MKRILATTLLLSLLGCTEDREFYGKRIERASQIEVELKTITKATGDEEPKEYRHSGYGFIVGNYLFTVDHVVSTYSVTYRTPLGTFLGEIKD